jgi:hypothetical protein
VLDQQDEVLEFGRAAVDEVPPELREAGGVLATPGAAADQG